MQKYAIFPEDIMRRCFQLAYRGMGRVAPNPMVGCVIVAEGRILGEGYHRCYGEAHAEVNALNSVRERSLLSQATLYVNLEPCSHYGKTPPCALRLIQEGIRKVVISNTDTNPQVAGRGIALLREAGVQVETGLLSEEGWQLNRRFFTYHSLHRPHILLKWAQSADGFLDGEGKRPLRISSALTKALVHQSRAESMAILIGKTTALKDNPKLHTRHWFGPHPLRLLIDRRLSVPTSHHLYDGSVPTLIYNEVRTDAQGPAVRLDFDRPILPQMMDDLYQRGIQSLMVEGGTYTLQQFIDALLYDEVQIEIGKAICGRGTPAPRILLPAQGECICYGEHTFYRFHRTICHSAN